MQAITLTLQLDADDDSLSGFASDADGERRDFSGWLGLISALESLLSQPHTNGGPR